MAVARLVRLAALAGLTAIVPSSRYIHLPIDSIIDLDREFTSGSRIDIETLTPEQVDDLVVLAKVWGFLKYHHLRVTSGYVQWDFELFRVLPRVLDATDADERNAVMLAWVDSLGPIPDCWRCTRGPTNVHLPAPIDWIRDEAVLGEELSASLVHVWKTRPSGLQFWVGVEGLIGLGSANGHGVGNAALHEPWYPELADVDAGYRILAAFRLWNIIEYWFPYRDLIDESWDGVLRELLPVFVAAESRADYQRALLLLMARVHDGHLDLADVSNRPPVGECGLDVRFVEGQAMLTSVRRNPELRVGDVLLEIDGQAVDDLVEAVRAYYSGSNDAARLQVIGENFTRGECGPVHVVVDRGGEAVALEVERVELGFPADGPPNHARTGEPFQRLGNDVAYLNASRWQRSQVSQYIDDAMGTRGLVIDIRNYPNDFLVFEIGPHLVEVETPFFAATVPDQANPGAFTWADVDLELITASPFYAGKVVILVDEAAMSSAEFTAMAFRAAPNSIVIGSPTAGADGNVSDFALPGRQSARISGIGIFYPDGRPTQRVGIVPDIEVHPTRAGIEDGRDEVLEQALREILGPEPSAAEIRELAKPLPQP